MVLDTITMVCQTYLMYKIKKIIFIIFSIFSCNLISDEIQPVGNFNISQYLGKWYEIARLDHWFERDMAQVSASYSMEKDGSIIVINRGIKKSDKHS